MKKENIENDPILQFEKWMNEAMETDLREPNAFTLATATKDAKPSCRVLLLKSFDHEGFVFFTNYESKKGRDLSENPFVSINFWWSPLERQVRIEGVAEKVRPEVSDEYFQSRPRGSQIGGSISPQSSIIPDREYLENKVDEFIQKNPEGPVPRPANWGGFLVKPFQIEFWQGRPDRLHDRLQYSLQDNGDWVIDRLAP